MTAIKIVVLALLLAASSPASGQDGHFGRGHDYWHQNYYSQLVTPDTKVSCCSDADCRPTSGRAVGNTMR